MMKFVEHLSAILRKLYHYILLDDSLVEGYCGVGFNLMLFLIMQRNV
jgi:outer membrane protein W